MSLRYFAFTCAMMLCFLVILVTFYKPDFKFPMFCTDKERDCSLCPKVLANEIPTQASNPNCSSTQLINPTLTDTPEIQGAAAPDQLETVVLIWMWPFGFKFDLSCSEFRITGCHLTDDKSLYHKAHGVLFHHRDIDGNLAVLPKEPRPYFQKWVWFNMESPANSGLNPKLDNLFNLTSSYRLSSNIPVRYGYLEPLTSEGESFKLPAKNKLACWIVSNWNNGQKRAQFYYKLKAHININVFGQAFGPRLSDEDHPKVVSSCKFFLSFENSVYQDYITEKVYTPMILGSVPIVLGPPRQNYEEYIPSDSFIHVDDFSTPKDLAERLLYLDQNTTEYMKYFNWKKRFEGKIYPFGQEHACRTCSYLQKYRGYQAFHGLNKWYWG